jgi:hypothetical protein
MTAGPGLGRLGVEVELRPTERVGAQCGGTSVYFRDPDGSLLEFISYGVVSERLCPRARRAAHAAVGLLRT